MFEIFKRGGPILWPLFFTSVVSLAVILGRIFFLLDVKLKRRPQAVEDLLILAGQGRMDEAIKIGEKSGDFVAQALAQALRSEEKSLSGALLSASNFQLKRFSEGLVVLDTVITLAPLLGLLSTVTGMIHAFGLLGNKELEAPAVITGGIAEALIGTAYGLGIAIVALIPFNYVNSQLESARRELEIAATRLELLEQPEEAAMRK